MVELRARRTDRERGASLVEFALVVPLLTLFLFGIVQFGIAYDLKQSVNSAAREGARYGALPGSETDEIIDATRAGFVGVADSAHVQIEVRHTVTPGLLTGSATPCSTAGNVIVRATVRHELTIPFFGAPEVDISGRGEFRCETP